MGDNNELAAVKSDNSIDTNDPADYTTLAGYNLEEYDEYGDERYQKFTERQYRSDISTDTVKCLFHAKYKSRWCGVLVMKSAFDFVIYQQMMQEVRPRTIIETGTWLGASAAWFGDMAKNFGLDCKVYSMDITNPDAVDKRCGRDNVTFLHGDNNKIDATFTSDMLKNLPHPWLVIEDAHVNVVPVMEHFTTYMRPGDYLVMEDLAPDQPLKSGMGLVKELGWEPFGGEAYKFLEEFMQRNADKYVVDRYYCDMFGYNGHAHWNGFLKRV